MCVAPDITELTREPSNLVGKPRSYNQLVPTGVHDHFESGGARTPVLRSARWAAGLFSSVAIARAYERTGRLPSNTRQAPFGLNLTCGLGAQLIRVRRPTLIRRRPLCACGLGTIRRRRTFFCSSFQGTGTGTLPVVVVVIVAVVEVLLLDLGKTLEARNYSTLKRRIYS